MDVIGIGAVNLDYIVSDRSLAGRLSETSHFESLADWGSETAVDDDVIDEVLDRLAEASVTPSVSPGGSAFNTLHALTRLDLGLSLGMVAAVGTCPERSVSLEKVIEDLGIERSFLRFVSDVVAGRCVSFIDDGERTMLTSEGASAHALAAVAEDRDGLIDYLASARVVHVTSLLGVGSAEVLADLLQDVVERSPQTLISFDPGFAWAEADSPGVHRILALSALIFLNYREFQLLGGHRYAEADEAIAARLFGNCGPNCEMIVLKKYDGVEVFRVDSGEVLLERLSRVPLAKDVIEDATGAGDVFAAGVLAAVVSAQIQGPIGVAIGLAMARHKLRFVGTSGYAGFADIGSKIVSRALATAADERTVGTMVFVDMVGSTDRAQREGDSRADEVLNTYKQEVRDSLHRTHGHEANNPGDGFLLLFEGPGIAIDFALELLGRLTPRGIGVRIGMHTGPYLMDSKGDLSGLAVNVAARINALAVAQQILVSRTCRDLVADGSHQFASFGRHELKGSDEPWDIYEVQRPF